MVATDLDGTLVRNDGRVSPFTAGVLAELDRRGVTVVIVTARPLRWMDDVWQHVGNVEEDVTVEMVVQAASIDDEQA